MANPYSRFFYSENRETSRPSAEEVVPFLVDLIAPTSVVDVGCGIGTWLSVFRERGVEDVRGIDGDYVDRSMLQIPADDFMAHDLATPLDLGRAYDLAISLEVAEHLDPDRAEAFVALLTGLAPIVVFSAAFPRQGGDHHVNEQWPPYWIAKFAQRGYQVVDCVRRRFWENERVEYWYAQNMFIFASEEGLAACPALAAERQASAHTPLSCVHPRAWLTATDPRNWDFKQILVGIPFSLRSAIVRRTQALSANRRRRKEQV